MSEEKYKNRIMKVIPVGCEIYDMFPDDNHICNFYRPGSGVANKLSWIMLDYIESLLKKRNLILDGEDIEDMSNHEVGNEWLYQKRCQDTILPNYYMFNVNYPDGYSCINYETKNGQIVPHITMVHIENIQKQIEYLNIQKEKSDA